MTSRIVELFGHPTDARRIDWSKQVVRQQCPFLDRKCTKTRKSEPEISIGTCTVAHGEELLPAIICPIRLRERHQIFLDCIHLLSLHEPGNEVHAVPEVSVPGGSLDFFLVSARNGKVKDFVGIELQTLDTTGTVWPERQRFLHSKGVSVAKKDIESTKPFGMNWKMTAKTILVQLHHKIQTFEHLSKHLVLVVQDHLLSYMEREFSFGHMNNPARVGDSMHFHAYCLTLGYSQEIEGGVRRLQMATRKSTDSEGIATALGLQVSAKVEMEVIVNALESKMSDRTRLSIG